MATITETNTVCDIYGVKKDVQRIRITVERRKEGEFGEEWKVRHKIEKDLGKRARDRLDGLVLKGVTKPNAGEDGK
jgi:hypothetical protein